MARRDPSRLDGLVEPIWRKLAQKLTEQGSAMESQLGLEREALLEQIIDRRELANQLTDARAQVTAASGEPDPLDQGD